MEKTAQRLTWIIAATIIIACISWADFLVQKKHHLIGGGINRIFLFLLINAHLLITGFLLYLIIRHSVKLFMERRRGVAGSLFTRNLVLSFVLFSVLPASFIMTMAGSAIIKNINQWFSVRLDSVFANTYALHCIHTATIRNTMVKQGEKLAANFASSSDSVALLQEAARQGMESYVVHDIASRHWLHHEIEQWRHFRVLNDRTTRSLRSQFIALLQQHSKGSLFDFFGSLYWSKKTSTAWVVLVHRYPPAVRQALIATQNAQHDYAMIKMLRGSIQLSYLSSFALMVLFVVFLSLWAAFYLARGITKPLAQLLEGTQRLQQGDLTTRVPEMPDSDLAQLADAFNRMAKALADMQQRLEQEQKVKTWQEAAKQLAHEIKNPLTPIQLATERLQRKFGEQLAGDHIFYDCTTTIIDQVTTIKGLVKHFVEFASLPAVCLEECNIALVIEDVVRLYRVSYSDAEFILVGDFAAPFVVVQTDKTKLKLALVNLIDNSIRAMQGVQAKPEISIKLECDASGDQIVLTIADNGPGIAKQVKETLFLPYVSTSKKNMGLGLAIVHQIFKQLGGSINLIASAKGAVFVCRLPRGQRLTPS
jgi:nitrogen fixation/metabolism regulation signal transduction histidine kinase